MTPVDPALVTRIAASIRSDVKPVRPMLSTNALVACLLAIFAAVSLGGAAILGFNGVRRLRSICNQGAFVSRQRLA